MIKTMEIINNPGSARVLWVILNGVEMDNLGNNITGIIN